MVIETEIDALSLQAKECPGAPPNHKKLRRGKEGFSPTAFTGSVAVPIP